MATKKTGKTSSKPVNKKSKKYQKAKRKRIIIIEIIVLLILLIGIAIWSKLGKINWNHIGKVSTNELSEETEKILEQYTTIALFGVDNRSNGNYDSGNSDSMMIASINNKTKEVKIISLYRDTYLNMDGKDSYRKCNYAYNHGGPKEAMEMMNRNLDLNIQDYVAVDFNALVEAVDAVGGVTLDITGEEAGCMLPYIEEINQVTGKNASIVLAGPGQTLNGVQATAYCRVRYTAGDDFKRTERQRIVLSQLIEKAKKCNASQLNDLINGVFPDISTSFSLTELISMASAMQQYELVDASGFPYSKATGTYGSKGSIVVPCTLESNVISMYANLYGKEDYVPSSTVKSISQEIQSFTGKSASDGY